MVECHRSAPCRGRCEPARATYTPSTLSHDRIDAVVFGRELVGFGALVISDAVTRRQRLTVSIVLAQRLLAVARLQ